MTRRVVVLDPRTDGEPPGWASYATRHRLHSEWDFGLMRVQSWLARNPQLLAVVCEDDEIIGAVAVMLCRPWWEPRFAAPAVHSRQVRPRWAEVCLPWLSGYPGWTFTPDLPESDRRAMLRLVERELARYAGYGLLGVVYRAVPGAEVALAAGRGRVVRAVDPTAVLTNRWTDADDWVATLGRERRASIRRYGRKIDADPTLTVRFGPAREDLDPHELATLLHGHRTRLGIPAFDRRTRLSGPCLDVLVRRPDVHTLTYRDADGRLLAFSTLLDHPGSAVFQHWAALPVEDGGRHNLYFDCYRRCVGHMVEHGSAELSSGRGMLDVKASLGFTARELWSVAVPRIVMG